MNDRQREQARIRQARRRARLKEEGASVTVTLTNRKKQCYRSFAGFAVQDEQPIQRMSFPTAADPKLATVAGAKGAAGEMPGLRKAESGGRLRRRTAERNL